MPELNFASLVAASLRDREVFSAFRAGGAPDENLSDDIKPIWELICEYYDADSAATSVDVALLRTSLDTRTRDPKRRKHFSEVLDSLSCSDPSIPNARRAVASVRRGRIGERLATKLLTGGSLDEVGALIEEYQDAAVSEVEDEPVEWSAEGIRPPGGGTRVPVYPASLGTKIRGGLLPGHHLTIFARPETGKSALALTIACQAAARNFRVLYLGNEDPVRDLMIRALQIFAQRSTDEVYADLPGAIGAADRQGSRNLLFKDMTPGTLFEVDRQVRKYKPALLVVDQMRGLLVPKSDNLTQRLDTVAQGMRAIAKRHQLAVVSITQAGDSGRGKAVLNDGDVDSSNTGVSAACDVLLGIGCTDEGREAGIRTFSLCKNKLGGSHDHIQVRLDPRTLQFRTDN